MFAWRKNEKRAAGGEEEEEEVEEERDKPSRRTDDGTAKKEKKGGITCELRARRPEGYFSPFLFVCLLFCFFVLGLKVFGSDPLLLSLPAGTPRRDTQTHTYIRTQGSVRYRTARVQDGGCVPRCARLSACL